MMMIWFHLCSLEKKTIYIIELFIVVSVNMYLIFLFLYGFYYKLRLQVETTS